MVSISPRAISIRRSRYKGMKRYCVPFVRGQYRPGLLVVRGVAGYE
jgi:hypothetical protein